MQLRKGLRGVAAVGLSAATLLSLCISGVANADNVPLNGVTGKITVEGASRGHNLEAVLLADYQSVQATDNNPFSDLTNVAFTTDANVKQYVTDAANQAGNKAGKGTVVGDPMNWVATNLASSPAKPWSGDLRNFVTELAKSRSQLLAYKVPGPKTNTSNNPRADVVFDGLKPGIYVIFDTSNKGTDLKGNGASAAIPMLVSTTVGDHSTLNRAPIGKVVMKNGDLQLTKKMVKVNGESVKPDQHFKIGDEITYTLETTGPNLVGYEKPYYFHIQDHPTDGLTYVTGSQTVNVQDVGDVVLDTSEFRVIPGTTPNGNKYLDWNLSNKVSQTWYEKKITITYKMKINDSGKQNNSASMFTPADPSKKPKDPSDIVDPNHPGDDVIETPSEPSKPNPVDPNDPDSPVIPTNPDINAFGVDLKHIVETTGAAVPNARYEVSYNGNKIPFKLTNDEYQNMENSNATGTSTEIKVGTDGMLKIRGLSAGKYEFKMIEAGTSPFPLKHDFSITIAYKSNTEAKFDNTADVWNLVKAHTIKANPANTVGELTVPDAATASQLPITGGAGIILVVALAVLAGGVVVVTSVMRRRALMTAKK
ncbi:fimbrial isopeptide formation D2 domain-containing protein [Bifidobacterium commune]|uniref:Fimbrial isopeptide formation D2 domain-containing protein n=1 Tax=Bifidobacterium commune TaxID=1505727 RepID=A0A1C4H681_9BIFI|nr:isopeptide-forming domain-containing fimbrial protein [Bifidobacterium commune]SCC80397.1 fimbrial isopeptide formation D2 domain-containing protein [Bifidobacterium commune]